MAGTEVEKLIKEKWPEAKIMDASDDIHHERFEVIVDVEECKELLYKPENKDKMGVKDGR